MSKCFNILLLAVKEKYIRKVNFKDIFISWLNAKTHKDKFSALHYSAYRGNVELCQVLVDLGADINVTNLFGLTALHISA